MKEKFVLFSLFVMLSAFLRAQNYSPENSHEISRKNADSASVKPSRLQLGGYGEAVMQRMFYNDDILRYSSPASYKTGNHGRFDLPHVVFYIGYDFGRGWKLGAEVEFEHGGAGAAVEVENEEGGEYESEIEKGGEVILEQFWLEKSWSSRANLRMGHIIVPVGLTNMHHMPTEFFSVLRPEEETSLIPCTWHETGISFWGNAGKWRYEIMFVAGLDAERFSHSGWVSGGLTSPYEFSIANQYAGAFRIDNSSIKGLRIGLSGFYGHSAHNSLKSIRYKNKNVNGAVSIGAIDAVYNDYNILFRGNFLYGHLADSYIISTINTSLPSASPSPRKWVASDATSWYVELGYDVMSLFRNRQYKGDKLWIYGHYGYYNSMYKMQNNIETGAAIEPKAWCEKNVISGGVNYYPMSGLVIKAEYSLRQFKAPYNNEPTLSLGIGYSGFFN